MISREATRRQDGFSLVELVTVVVVIGILLIIAIPIFWGTRSRSEVRTCWQNQRNAETQYQTYRASEETSTVPADWDELMDVLVDDYLIREPECPTVGVYQFDGQHVTCTVVDHERE
jgi:prepilin-type N-terminal cleavage/methylation domain-containing protein